MILNHNNHRAKVPPKKHNVLFFLYLFCIQCVALMCFTADGVSLRNINLCMSIIRCITKFRHVQIFYAAPEERNNIEMILIFWTLHSVTFTASAADAPSCLSSSAAGSENKWEVLPSFHVTNMFPSLRSLASPLDGEVLCPCSGLSTVGLLLLSSLGGETASSSSAPSNFWAIAAAVLYFAISFLFLS